MILISCADNKLGLMFNLRRQSRDREITRRVLELSGGRLYMGAYSAPLFGDFASCATVRNDFILAAGPGDFCFAEAPVAPEFWDKIEKLILFRWNRVYPADTHLSLPLEKWRLAESTDFCGSSHERITQEVYVR